MKRRRTVSIVGALLSVALVVFTWGCASASARREPRSEVLLSGDQELVDAYTRAIVFDKMQINLPELADDRPVSNAVLLLLDFGDHHLQLDPERISEFNFCLLSYQTGEQASTSELFEECRDPIKCNPCNSGTYPLSNRVREFHREFWKRRLQGK
jgi:hypothetical protein